MNFGNPVLGADGVDEISFLNLIVAVRDDDLTVAGKRSNQNVGKNLMDIRHGQTHQSGKTPGRKFRHGDSAAFENSVAQCVLFRQVFVDLHGDGHVRIDDVVDVHRILDEVELIHMLRVADAGDHMMASQLLGKGSDDHVRLVAGGHSKQVFKRLDADILQHGQPASVVVDGHDIELL